MYEDAKYANTTAGHAQERDRGQASVHLDRVCALVEEALNLQHQIEGRLTAVTRPPTPTLSNEKARPAEVLVAIADTLNDKSNMLGQLVQMQRDLLQRIEL